MKKLPVGACLLFSALVAFAAVPDYKAFRGVGGITVVSNPPTGTIEIDGSGISAGALPSFALTNNQTSKVRLANDVKVDGVFTNAGGVKLEGLSTSNRLMVLSPAGDLTNAFKLIRVETNQSHILSNIVSSASSGQTVLMGNGEFYIGAQQLVVPVGVNLLGSGSDTAVYGTVEITRGPIVVINSSNEIGNFRIVGADAANNYQADIGYSATAGHRDATNVYIHDMELEGQSDCIYILQSNYCSVKFERITSNSKWHSYWISSVTGTGTNYCEVWDSYVKSDLNGATFSAATLNAKAEGAVVGSGTTVFYNSEIIGTNANNTLAVILANNGRVHIHNSVLRSAGTNGAFLLDNITDTGSPTTSPIFVSDVAITDSDLLTGSVATYASAQFSKLQIGNRLIMPWVAKTNDATVNGNSGPNQYANLVANTNLTFIVVTNSTSPSDWSNSIPIKVSFTQDSTGTRTLTFNGAAVGIDTNANATTDVLFWVQNGATNVSPGVPILTSVASSGQVLVFNGRAYTNAALGGHLTFSDGKIFQAYLHDYIDAGAFVTNATNWSATFNLTNHYQAGPQIFYTFNDTATNEVFFRVTAPQAYSGEPIKAKFHWTSTNVTSLKTNTWGIAGKKASGIDFDDSTFGTRVDIRSSHTAGKEYNTSPATAAVTINGSPVGGNLVYFRVTRDPNDANDNMVGQNRLHAVEIQWPLTNAPVAAW